jgi:kinetochore protein Spc7/SPC105
MPPLREIPAHVASRNVSPRKPFPSSITTPTLNQNVLAKVQNNASVTGGADPPNDFALDGDAAAVETKVMLRTEEEQQIAAREREELERKAAEKDLNSRREARRKSLANRRVSFAPEATLHTWDVVEYMQDSTTSSASTDSTRRASSASSGITESPHSQTPRTPGSDASEPPSTPPEQDEDETVASPEHQRDLHQKKRRRSSAIPPLNFNNPDDETFSSSPYSELSVEDGEDADEGFITDDNNTSDSNSESDDEGTAMSLDMGDNTDMSMASVRSTASSTGSSARLEAALQQAARQAGTQGIDFDEHGETENPEEEEIVASFQPWSKKNLQPLSSLHDQENINPFPKALADVAAGLVDDEDDDDEGMTMDMTRAVGQILPAVQESDDEMTMDMTTAIGGIINKPREASSNTRRKSMPSGRRKSTRRRSSAEGSSFGDETMDLTMAIGGIQQFSANEQSAPDSAEDEDMTMEFTSVIGGVLAAGFPATRAQRRTSTKDSGPINTLRRDSIDSNNDTMDMTVAFGGIVPSILEASDSDGNVTVGMDMTLAIGRILPNQGDPAVRTHARRVMEEEVDSAEAVSSPFQTLVPSSAQKAVPAITMASETGSPSLVAIRGKALRRSGGPRVSSTPKSMVPETPIKTPSTPTKQITPNPSRPTTPAGKTPPSKNVTMRTSSPKKLFSDQLKPHTTTPKSTNSRRSATPNRLFNKDNATPSIVLTPKQRRSSGLGIDKTGLGSPRIAALLDRRVSIGESAMSFSPGQFDVTARGVRFDDPQVIEEILDKEREADKDQEDGRKILEREVDAGDEEKDATVNLKEMIQSLTPKKRQLKGRKSLHVGAARGILGKRPAELDEDEEEEQDGVKRLKNHQGSPVKNVRLQAPPTKSETTGRPPRLILEPLEATSNNITTPTAVSSPLKGVPVTTPRGQGRFKDVGSKSSAQKPPSYSDKAPLDEYTMNDEDNSEDNMRLQDFLNLTSIRFMELTTTKRRHTVAPGAFGEDGVGNIQNSQEIDNSLESCVVAGACTVPMLELFQHVSAYFSQIEYHRLTSHSPAMSSESISLKVDVWCVKLRPKQWRRILPSSENISMRILTLGC